jgi:hypothetical protein
MAGVNRTTGKATDLITFSRASGGTALRKISYGSELVTDGGFDDPSAWTTSANTSVSGGVGSFNSPTVNGDYIFPAVSIGIVPGSLYQVTYTVKNYVSGSVRPETTGGGTVFIGQVATADGTYTEIMPALGTNHNIRFRTTATNSDLDIDNISVKEVLFDQPDGTLTLFNHPNNIPRIEYDADGTVKGLLIEESRTNLLLRSEEFDNAAWSLWDAGDTLVPNAVAAPDGSVNGYLFAPDSTSGNHIIRHSFFFGTTTQHTISAFIKFAGRQYVQVAFGGATLGLPSYDYRRGVFDVQTGVVVSAPTDGTARIEDFGNGWYRCSVTITVLTAQAANFDIYHASSVTPTNNVISDGNGADGVYIWGAQLEVGAFPTSYMLTSGSAATRAADIASISVDNFGYRQDAGTVVVEWNSDDDTAHIANFYTDASNRWVVLKDAGNQKSFVSDGGTAVMNSVIATAPSGDNKSAMSISPSSGSGVINGGTVVSDTSVSVPAISNLAIGKDEALNYYLNGHIKSIAYYPRRLSNAQLQELTA